MEIVYMNSDMISMDLLEEIVKNEIASSDYEDKSHDFGHLSRVSSLALRFAEEGSEPCDKRVVLAAGMLHDIVNLPKNHPDAKKCSYFASIRAAELLKKIQFPEELIPRVCHAIHAHSFSAQVETKTIEAKYVQDADRMEALGALGLMRVFYVSGKMNRAIIHEKDPEGLNRKHNDKEYGLDHFPIKLLTLTETMKTESGKKIAHSLSLFLEEYRNQMIQEQKQGDALSARFSIAKTYYNAGKSKQALFHPEDPFAEKRPPDPSNYALDSLLNHPDPYITTFLNQLKYELNGYR